MLYDPKWEQKTETKPDPFTLESLIAWLEKKPATETYCYTDNGRCLLSRYFTAAGFKNVHMFDRSFWHGDKIPGSWGQEEAIEHGGDRIALLPSRFNDVAIRGKYTFGAALKRARELANSSKS